MEHSSPAEIKHQVVMQKNRGWSMRQIARVLQISRNTVSKILKKVKKQRDEGHDILEPKVHVVRPSKLDDYLPLIKELLEKYDDITGQRMFEELQDKGYQGGISILREKMQQMQPKPVCTPIVRFSTDPGEQGQMDWSPYTLKFQDGHKHKVVCFSYVLGYSRRHYVDFVPHRDYYTLIRRHQETFSYFGGSPEQCLYDSEKTVVLRWEAQRPIFNPAFLQFITHYECKPIACTRGRPQTKGKIEGLFGYIEKNLLNARDFDSLEDLRAFGRWWMKNRSDVHIHDTTRRAPLELFMAEEAHKLQSLPLHPYDTSEVGFRLCGLDGFVEWKTNRYSVPLEYVGEIMTVKVTDTEVIVYNPNIEKVARHERIADSMHRPVELSEHRTNSKQIRYGLEPVRETFMALGDAAEEFLTGLQKAFPRNCGYHARRILLLKERFHSDDVHRALQHAMRYYAFECLAVERIIQARSRPRTLEECLHKKSAAQLRGVLPPIRQRSLAEYQSLLQPADDEKSNPPVEEGDDEGQEATGHFADRADPATDQGTG